ncbi:MAG: hypothetical protein GX272_08625 [Epulopiscium sp.]|jgi:hypothetical protein|nr:hypothetical protein [Candidatus Epulonipiscium sp.]
MRNLNEIIEDCQLNKMPSADELRYAVLVLTRLMNLAMQVLHAIYKKDTDTLNKMRIENVHNVYNAALNKSPKEFLGWDNDPENSEYQKFHALASKLMDKAMKGELPNQKK